MTTETIKSFFIEHRRYLFPQEFGPWIEEDLFDPRFKRKILETAEQCGYIEIDKTNFQNWYYRFTLKGTNKRLSYDA